MGDTIIQRNLEQIKQRYQAKLLSLPYVVGVGIGIKQRKGQTTQKLCLKVYVQKKAPKHNLLKKDVIPKKLGGIETDVEEIGRVTAQ